MDMWVAGTMPFTPDALFNLLSILFLVAGFFF